MPTLLERSTEEEKNSVPTNRYTSRKIRSTPFILSLLIGCLLTILVASLQNDNKTDEEKLAELQIKVENHIPLEKYEKEAYCELLWKVKGIQLCTCNGSTRMFGCCCSPTNFFSTRMGV